jgi:cytochrome P450
LSDRELRDAAVTLLLAGHETTANALAWTFYLLSQSPDVDQRLHQATDDFDSTAIPASEPSYAERVFYEAIRLYPSVWIIERRAVADDEIGGYAIPAGSTVMLSPYVLHRHPEFWPEPDRFIPKRFTPDACSDRPRHAYIPFGAGPHQCVGQNMALLVARIVITLVNRQFHLQLVPEQTITPQPGITLRHTNGLRMTLHLRP